MIRLALLSALSDRAEAGQVVLVDEWTFPVPRTKDAVAALSALGLHGKVLVVLGPDDGIPDRSFANLPHVRRLQRAELNAYDVIRSDWIVFSDATLPGETTPASLEDLPAAAVAPAPQEADEDATSSDAPAPARRARRTSTGAGAARRALQSRRATATTATAAGATDTAAATDSDTATATDASDTATETAPDVPAETTAARKDESSAAGPDERDAPVGESDTADGGDT
jgi:hypothetical protein